VQDATPQFDGKLIESTVVKNVKINGQMMANQ